jgi:lipopolysaccharide/colanic/teichoic acid biosynthesis glycosyltransferase
LFSGDPSESGIMQPDHFATPSDRFAGRMTASSRSGSRHGFVAATATLSGTVESPVEAAGGPGAGSVHALSPSSPAHGFVNGTTHPGTHPAAAIAAWSSPVSASAGAGLAHSPATVLAAHLEPRGYYLRHGKRLLDVLGAGLALILHAPLLLLAALAIKLESRGPVFYRSTRIGKNGRPFTFLKLRSMVDGADRVRHHVQHLNEAEGPIFKISNDPRVTRVGRFLRVTSIDEIPQFFNVLRGEMSLVGPRPPLPAEVAQYEPWQLHRLDVLPGITCLWQISGRSRIGFQEWMRLDLEYIRHQSLKLDLKILLRTIPAVLSREGAY